MHQTRVLPWVRASRVGDDGVQLVCQAWFWLKQLVPARLDVFSSGEGTMDTSPPLPPGITQPWGGSMVLWLEQARAVLLPPPWGLSPGWHGASQRAGKSPSHHLSSSLQWGRDFLDNQGQSGCVISHDWRPSSTAVGGHKDWPQSQLKPQRGMRKEVGLERPPLSSGVTYGCPPTTQPCWQMCVAKGEHRSATVCQHTRIDASKWEACPQAHTSQHMPKQILMNLHTQLQP